MLIKDLFEVGIILEDEEKAKDIAILTGDDCKIVSKLLNKKKIILHMQRQPDGSEGNVFVRLKDEHEKEFATSKKLLASKKVIGLSLNEFKNLEIESL
ncbi:MAG: hypothetical protein AAB410_05435 [Patescibacteria group bacterium]